MKKVTLEAWVTIPAEEGVQDVLLGRYANSKVSSKWSDRYDPSMALDQDLETYWSSELVTGVLGHNIQFEVDFGKVIWSEGWKVYWFHLAQDFAAYTADEGYHGEKLEWRELDRM